MRTCIGFDIGRSAVKIIAGSILTPSVTIEFPSGFSVSSQISDAASASRAALETVKVAGEDYFVGETALFHGGVDLNSGFNDGWSNTTCHAALFLSGLRRLRDAGVSEIDESIIVVGLPARLQQSQSKSYRSVISNYLPRATIKVVPQPMGPYFSMLFDRYGGSDCAVDESSWGFVEVGQFTTDFALLMNGRSVERSLDSCDGMRVAAESLQKLIINSYRLNVSLAQASSLLANPSLKSYGSLIDVSELVKQSVAPLARMIADKAGQIFGDHINTLSGVRIAGGGASLVRDAIAQKWSFTPTGQKISESFVSVLPTPKFAVADGFFKFAIAHEISRNQLLKV